MQVAQEIPNSCRRRFSLLDVEKIQRLRPFELNKLTIKCMFVRERVQIFALGFHMRDADARVLYVDDKHLIKERMVVSRVRYRKTLPLHLLIVVLFLQVAVHQKSSTHR